MRRPMGSGQVLLDGCDGLVQRDHQHVLTQDHGDYLGRVAGRLLMKRDHRLRDLLDMVGRVSSMPPFYVAAGTHNTRFWELDAVAMIPLLNQISTSTCPCRGPARRTGRK